MTIEKTITIPDSILNAGNITYNNTESGLTADNVQNAIDEIQPIALTDEEIAAICDFDGEIESDVIPIATKAALGCVVAGNGLSITEDGILSLENDITPITKGGTGAKTLPEARQNINYIGLNPITSPDEDIVDNWSALGTGIAFTNTNGLLTDQPVANLMIYNMVGYNDDVHQLAFQQRVGGIWHRGGNLANGWNGTWRRILDENSGITKKLLWENASPTSEFNEQKIDLDLSEYDAVEIEQSTTGSSTYMYHRTIPVGLSSNISSSPNIDVASGYMYFVYRNYITSVTGVQVSVSGTRTTNTTTITKDNTKAIPRRIYGIKGVQ